MHAGIPLEGPPVVLAARRRRSRRGSVALRIGSAAQPAWSRSGASVLSALVLAVEAAGSLLLWAPIPLAWMWVGSHVYAVTKGSLLADCSVALGGFLATTILVMKGLVRLDAVWVGLRRRAGRDQPHGALTGVVVVTATFGLLGFTAWYYLLSHAFIIPFMPNR